MPLLSLGCCFVVPASCTAGCAAARVAALGWQIYAQPLLSAALLCSAPVATRLDAAQLGAQVCTFNLFFLGFISALLLPAAQIGFAGCEGVTCLAVRR